MPYKKANGEGSVQKYYKNGVPKGWRTTITIGRDDKGRLIRKQFYGKTKLETIKKKDDYLNKSAAGMLPADEKITVQEWFKIWLYEYRINDLRPSTLERYCGIYKIYILNSSIGLKKLKDLKTSNIQSYYNILINEKNKTPNIVKTLNKLLKSGLNQALKEQYIIINPCNSVTLPKLPPKKEIKIFTVEEEKKFIKSLINHRNRALFILTLGTGLRQGEVLALKWPDINFKDNELKVQRTFKRVQLINSTNSKNKTQIIIQEPKTKNSKRTIPIPSSVISELKKHRAKQAEEKLAVGDAYVNNDLVFSNSIGEPIDARNITRSYTRALKRANISYKNFHAMRHTYATRLFEADVPLKTVQELLGHSDISTTANTYTHVLPKQKIKAVDRLNDLFIL
ncbi:tyrosine-type recombinase/integrase [Clostridium tyrobutyricum]|jgi:integrase|uniref:tyrosine-type recombinase/integrase n=1 Tax=Clostridium tyrobutyricum TaxID=1519 RepID=UPI001C394E1E|nr:site-specific integrase [Clostridium tyrobutyricum]MBV4429523.1 site-specific integrase [Clostridium tyrobutyricum]MBV4444744.1 site-specific integrase [Clostridium tyrobutyricum]